MDRLGCGAWRGEIEHFRVRDEFLLHFCFLQRWACRWLLLCGLGFFMNSAERLYRGRISEMSYQDCGRVDGERGVLGCVIFSP